MVIIALGGNIPGHKGAPVETMQWAIREMTKRRIHVMAVSSFYSTKPIGQEGQNDYINAVIRAQTSLSAANVLKNLKFIERAAGRNTQQLQTIGKWGSRPLDLDIIDYKNMVTSNFDHCNSLSRVTCRCLGPVTIVKTLRQGSLVLPHPRAHSRPFVMRPLLDLDPFWHHPVSGVSALSLWTKMSFQPEGQILHKL